MERPRGFISARDDGRQRRRRRNRAFGKKGLVPLRDGNSLRAAGVRSKGAILSRERMAPFDPPRERQGRFDLAPAPLATKMEGPCPSVLDYPPHGTLGKHCTYLG